MIQEPAGELLDAVRAAGDAPSVSARTAVGLVRRRFGLALPPPFVPAPAPGAVVPVRPAEPLDGPAIAAVKWRAWRTAHRGILPDDFLDDLAVDPPPGTWVARAVVAPSARHALRVAGARGVVLGFADVRPVRAVDASGPPAGALELCTLMVDPTAQRRGIGRSLVDAVVDHARSVEATGLCLWAVAGSAGARAFYEALGWRADGASQQVPLAPGVVLDEVRYRHPAFGP